MDRIIRRTHFEDLLGPKYEGKARDVYDQGDRVIIVSTDRHSSFDRNIAFIPHKGQVNNQITQFWMRRVEPIVPNHIIAVPDPNVTVAMKCDRFNVEFITREYLTGTTSTSIWTRYQHGERVFDGLRLPDGMKKNDKLPHVVFDPTTKEEDHDRCLSKEQLVSDGYISRDDYETAREICIKTFILGRDIAREECNLILVDEKKELGRDKYGRLRVIDELFTPDSSRYWQAATFEARIAQNLEPENFDKEFLRLYVSSRCNPYEVDEIPPIPQHLIDEMSRRYIAIDEQILREEFIPAEQPWEERMRRNLLPYVA